MEEITAKQRQTLETYFRWRLLVTPLFALDIAFSAYMVYHNRAQWPNWPTLGEFADFSIMHSIWANIFNVVIFSFNLVLWWFQVSRYQYHQAQDEIAKISGTRSHQAWPPAPRT